MATAVDLNIIRLVTELGVILHLLTIETSNIRMEQKATYAGAVLLNVLEYLFD